MKTKENDPQSTALKSMIDYSEDSIVSKVLHKTPNNNLTLFALDAGQEISEHTTPFDAYVYVPEGELEITIAGNVHKLREGDFIKMPENIPHALNTESGAKMLLIMMK